MLATVRERGACGALVARRCSCGLGRGVGLASPIARRRAEAALTSWNPARGPSLADAGRRRRPLRRERAYGGIAITADELSALALAADPDVCGARRRRSLRPRRRPTRAGCCRRGTSRCRPVDRCGAGAGGWCCWWPGASSWSAPAGSAAPTARSPWPDAADRSNAPDGPETSRSGPSLLPASAVSPQRARPLTGPPSPAATERPGSIRRPRPRLTAAADRHHDGDDEAGQRRGRALVTQQAEAVGGEEQAPHRLAVEDVLGLLRRAPRTA